MKLSPSVALLSLIPSIANVAGDVTSLNPENYHSLTAGKAVFIKFFAPWCGHCKSMASDFENLAAAHESDSTKLIAEVDCTDEKSQSLCQDHGVEGFPTLKYGDPTSLSDYQGGRDFDSMNGFVSSEVKVTCSPFNVDLCTGEEKKLIEDIMKMSDEEIEEEVAKVEAVMKAADDKLQKGIEGLQEKFEGMMQKHEAVLEELKKGSDYSLMKSILKMKKLDAGIVDGTLDDDDDAYDDDDYEDF